MAEKNSEKPAAPEAAPAAAAAKGGGGMGAMMPLIATIVLMPALAYVMTSFVIVPKLEKAIGKAPAAAGAKSAGGGHGEAAKNSGHGEAAKSGGHGGGGGAAAASDKNKVMLNKMINNVAGTMGTRYLLTSVTMVGNDEDIGNKVEEHKAQLLDVAAGTLSSKTIADLEKPGARNQIRSELMSVFNNVLGENAIKELFITELAIQ